MRDLPPSKFAHDLGAADPLLTATLEEYDATRAREAAVLEALSGVRLLVPVLATAAEVDTAPDGHQVDKRTDMSVPLLRRPDGRTALLAFSGLDALRRWNASARPSPVTVAEAAQVALSESASALLLDVAGPVRFVVETEDLRELAAGRVLVRTDRGHAWAVSARHGLDEG